MCVCWCVCVCVCMCVCVWLLFFNIGIEHGYVIMLHACRLTSHKFLMGTYTHTMHVYVDLCMHILVHACTYVHILCVCKMLHDFIIFVVLILVFKLCFACSLSFFFTMHTYSSFALFLLSLCILYHHMQHCTTVFYHREKIGPKVLKLKEGAEEANRENNGKTTLKSRLALNRTLFY